LTDPLKEILMSIRQFLQSPRARRGVAASVIALSLGGLVLFRAPLGSGMTPPIEQFDGFGDFKNGTTFSGPGALGSLSLSHGKVLANGRQRVFAELRLRADAAAAQERAPLAIAIVLDTSGSMSGNKLHEAKRSVITMLRQMRPDDEVAFVRYDSSAQLIQPMQRVSQVRGMLIGEIERIEASGGTNIPDALRAGMSALSRGSSQRVQRLVLVSDGLDSTRTEAERIAQNGNDRGVTVSSLGIGLDFDESYMASVARAGRGNFGFVENPGALARFLERELSETAATTLQGAVARLRLSSGLHVVRTVGAELRHLGDGEIALRMGSLFGGDERRVVIELEADGSRPLSLDSNVSWSHVNGGEANVRVATLGMGVTADPQQVQLARDGSVYARSLSALASVRQLEAGEAYAKGDAERARGLIQQNIAELQDARRHAPEAEASAMADQAKAYADTDEAFAAAPASPAGKAAAKRSAAKENANLGRQAY
jgi:Ca-activated chloride channel family protein